jgi:hypothetical protein
MDPFQRAMMIMNPPQRPPTEEDFEAYLKTIPVIYWGAAREFWLMGSLDRIAALKLWWAVYDEVRRYLKGGNQ